LRLFLVLCLGEAPFLFEDTKGVIRIHKSKKYTQENAQKKKDKWTEKDL
jgi:hypothetical protein